MVPLVNAIAAFLGLEPATLVKLLAYRTSQMASSSESIIPEEIEKIMKKLEGVTIDELLATKQLASLDNPEAMNVEDLNIRFEVKGLRRETECPLSTNLKENITVQGDVNPNNDTDQSVSRKLNDMLMRKLASFPSVVGQPRLFNDFKHVGELFIQDSDSSSLVDGCFLLICREERTIVNVLEVSNG